MHAAAWLLVALGFQTARGDAKSLVEEIERRPRAARPTAYERALAGEGLGKRDRIELTQAFARHAKVLSPAYGRGRFPYDAQKWVTQLKRAFDLDPRNADVAAALAQLLIDRGDRRAALPVVRAFRDAHPADHRAQAWLAWCESKLDGAGRTVAVEPITFPVHFCVITRDPVAHRAATREQCRKECDILNATFRALDGAALAKFEFKACTTYQQAKASESKLLDFGDRDGGYDGGALTKAFNACTDRRVRDPHALNVYIYDARSAASGSADATSHGRRNSNRPFVLIDWRRLNGVGQNAEALEMGHAFGLEHVGVPAARGDTSTNIMASAAEKFGSGGRRDLGFTPSQSAVVQYHAKRTRERLQASK